MTKQFLTIGSDKIKLKPDSKDETPFRYCGEYYDKETEEIYLRARYYQPEVGRFLTRDTYTGEEDEPESLHLYAYCGNDGVNYADPSGHWGTEIHRRMTKIIARGLGFNKTDAALIGEGAISPDKNWKPKKKKINKENAYWCVDIKVSDREVQVDIKDITKKSDTIYGHKYYKNGNKKTIGYKPDLHKVSRKKYKKAKKMPSAIVKKDWKYSKKLVLIGIWLHVLQDRWSHGLRSEHIRHLRGKGNKTDNYMYDYNKKTKKYKKYSFNKLLKKNKRLISTVNDTRKYLKLAKEELNKEKLPNNRKRVGKQIDNIERINKNIVSYLKKR